MCNLCLYCNKPIPDEKKSDSKYCSNACYKMAKKERDKKNYHANNAKIKEFKKNSKILERFAIFNELNLLIKADYLNKLKFNWGLSTDEININGLVFKQVGDEYAYRLEANETVKLWTKQKKK